MIDRTCHEDNEKLKKHFQDHVDGVEQYEVRRRCAVAFLSLEVLSVCFSARGLHNLALVCFCSLSFFENHGTWKRTIARGTPAPSRFNHLAELAASSDLADGVTQQQIQTIAKVGVSEVQKILTCDVLKFMMI